MYNVYNKCKKMGVEQDTDLELAQVDVEVVRVQSIYWLQLDSEDFSSSCSDFTSSTKTFIENVTRGLSMAYLIR